jgi:nicotinamide-nucleotide amidase
VSIRVTARAGSAAEAWGLADAMIAQVASRLGELVVGEGDNAMATAVGELLRRRGQSLATAESCTGGLIGKMITDVSGSSDYYLGGMVSYANAVKQSALGVSQRLLAEHGAVSEPVALEMAKGCREKFRSDWAVSATGIAGPGGGSPEKPVGLVYIGISGPGCETVRRCVFPGDREAVRLRAAIAAMNQLRLVLGPAAV